MTENKELESQNSIELTNKINKSAREQIEDSFKKGVISKEVRDNMLSRYQEEKEKILANTSEQKSKINPGQQIEYSYEGVEEFGKLVEYNSEGIISKMDAPTKPGKYPITIIGTDKITGRQVRQTTIVEIHEDGSNTTTKMEEIETIPAAGEIGLKKEKILANTSEQKFKINPGQQIEYSYEGVEEFGKLVEYNSEGIISKMDAPTKPGKYPITIIGTDKITGRQVRQTTIVEIHEDGSNTTTKMEEIETIPAA